MEDQSSKKGKSAEYDEDRISQLPGNVLNVILSHLTIREAVNTSVLATKWRYLWAKSLSNLTFNVHNMLDQEEYSSVEILHAGEFHKLIIPWKRMIAFLSSVRQFLISLSSDHKIEKMKVYFTFYRNEYGSHLDKWIRFAIFRGVEELDLDLLEVDYFAIPVLEGEIYDFPCDLRCDDRSRGGVGSFLKCLRLAHCNLAPKQTNLLGFNTITTLDLKWVDLESNECINNLLSICRALEWLSLRECYGFDYLRIVHPLCARLKYLNMCDCRDLNTIEINGINLEKFEYKGYEITFIFDEVSQLKTMFSHVVQRRMDKECVVSTLSTLPKLRQLENLFLCSSFHKQAESLPEAFPTFPNLKLLSIVEIASNQPDLLWVATLLKAYPSLLRLELHLHTNDNTEEPRQIKRLPRCPHEHLKEVVITGARGHSSEIEIAIHLLNNAAVLDKMTIDPRPRYYAGNGKWETSHASGSWMIRGRKRVIEYLTREARPQTVLMIV